MTIVLLGLWGTGVIYYRGRSDVTAATDQPIFSSPGYNHPRPPNGMPKQFWPILALAAVWIIGTFLVVWCINKRREAMRKKSRHSDPAEHPKVTRPNSVPCTTSSVTSTSNSSNPILSPKSSKYPSRQRTTTSSVNSAQSTSFPTYNKKQQPIVAQKK